MSGEHFSDVEPRSERVAADAMVSGRGIVGCNATELEFTTWPHYGKDQNRYAEMSDSAQISEPAVAWSSEPTQDSFWHSPVIDGERVYATNNVPTSWAFNIDDGSTAWSVSEGSGGAMSASPVVHEGVVSFFRYDGVSVGRDTETGEEVWRINWENEAGYSAAFESHPTLYEGTIIAADTQGGIHSINAQTGEVNWTSSPGTYMYSCGLVMDGYYYTVIDDDGIYKYDLADGSGQEVVDYPDANSGVRMYHTGELVVVDMYNERIIAFDPTDETLAWEAELGEDLDDAASTYHPATDQIVVPPLSDTEDMKGLDHMTGDVLWTLSDVGDPNWPQANNAPAGDIVYSSDGQGVIAVDPSVPEIVWTWTKSRVQGSIIGYEGDIFVAQYDSLDSQVFRLTEA